VGYWQLVEPFWGRIRLDDADSFLADYGAMPEAPRHLLSAHWLYSEVCNGGFHQFFSNSSGVLAPEALAGLRALGLAELGAVAADAMAFFPAPYPRDQMIRSALLDRYAEGSDACDDDDEAWNPFAALDDRFYSGLEPRDGETDRFVRAADAYAATFSERR
jgi:hypothetical protein